ncbi:hypothetical protein DPMN_135738 [Dreissena polymorpha]|uniref:Uncharacterized protein n=1 Tax=Dreissena polymorpha TaxID=45954 RepID=A0A9D4FYP5_DREPO|nr:hypothetical protein DPMN_135738 [Dreissena polymorpha]
MVRQKNFISQGNATVFGEENMATSGESLKIYYDCKVRSPDGPMMTSQWMKRKTQEHLFKTRSTFENFDSDWKS